MKNHLRRGFTLLELSVVLVIISLVTGMAISSGVSIIATARLSATQQKMKTIDDALMAYRSANDRLPCPGDLTLPTTNTSYGIEAANPGECQGGTPAANFTGGGTVNTTSSAVEGSIPAMTLGLPADFMVDGWGNRFRYAVDVTMTYPASFPAIGTGCNLGAVTVYDGSGNARTTSSIYALLSHGPNGHGAYTSNGVIRTAGSTNTSELANCHCSSSAAQTTYSPAYVQALPSASPTTATNSFDDIVTFKERWQMMTPWDKTGTCNTLVYVSDTSNNRIEIFTLGGVYQSQFGSLGSANGQINDSHGVLVDSSGNIWVSDSSNNRIEKFSSSGVFLQGFGAGYNGITGTIGSAGTGNGQFRGQWGITLDASGNLWVADHTNNRVQEINPSTGAFMLGIGAGYNGVAGTIGSSGTANGQFQYAAYLAFDTAGNLWASDHDTCRVEKFNATTGAFIMALGAGYNGVSGSVGTCGNSAGQINTADGLAVDSNNILYVASNGGNRILMYNGSTGAYLGFIGTGTAGSANGQLYLPDGITLDAYGNLWVGDRGNNRIEKFNRNGSYLGQFGTLGSGNGQLNQPFGVVFSSAR